MVTPMIDRDRALIERATLTDKRQALTYEEAEKRALRAIHDADGRGMVGRGRNHLHQRVARAILSAARDEGRAEWLGGEWVMVPRARLHEIIVDVLDSWHDGMRRRKADDILKAIPAPPASQTQEG